MKEYKIEVIESSSWSGYFKQDKIEELINNYAKNGWQIKQIVRISVEKDKLLIFFEKDK
jgi:hypothetical protein